MANVVSRSELRSLLSEWKLGQQTASEVHRWAEARYAMDDWDPEDDVANEVLAELDMLDMNLLTHEDVPILCAMLDVPPGEAHLAHSLIDSRFVSIDIESRKKALASDPLYAPFCGALSEMDREALRRCLQVAVTGHLFEDCEFSTLFGLNRSEVREVLDRWPDVDALDEAVILAVNNSVTNLVGYPHGQDVLSLVGATAQELTAALRRWRAARGRAE